MNTHDPLEKEDQALVKTPISTPQDEFLKSVHGLVDRLIEDEVRKAVHDRLERPQKVILHETPAVKILNTQDLIPPAKDIQKVEGTVKLDGASIVTVEQVESIVKRVLATVQPKDLQKITGSVVASVEFPEVQKVQGSITIDKVQNPITTNLPVLKGGDQDVIPVVLWDGKRMIDPRSMFSQNVQGNGKLTSLIQQLLNSYSDGWRTVPFTALTNAVVTVRGSKGKFGGYYLDNPNASKVYIQVFYDKTGISLGTTAPDAVFSIPASGASNLEISKGIDFNQSMQVAATTTATGSTAPGTALVASFYVNK